MQTSYISSQNVWNAPRTTAMRLQQESTKLTTETATGRYADVGLELGSRTNLGFTLRQQQAQLDALTKDNSVTSLRVDQTQATLQQLQSDAADTLKNLIAAPDGQKFATVSSLATTRLAGLISSLNAESDGQYIFAGLNTSTAPLASYDATSATKQAVDAAVTAEFNGANPSTITPDQMTAFLNGRFATLFDDANWKTTWSTASDTAITSRIAPDTTAQTSVSANATPFRSLAMAYILSSSIGVQSMPSSTQAVVAKKVTDLLSQAGEGLIGLQTDLGTTQAQIKAANTRMDTQSGFLTSRINDLEGVDTAAAKTRLDQVNTQIQISYSLTSQLRQLNLVSYLG
ncbi:flagellar hook-associated family protein [Methylobacterium sp. JK268]